ncbi:hypothetical protein DMH17_17065 [Raoultella planticola]|nr:hypothetical protein [Raoultella planticola]
MSRRAGRRRFLAIISVLPIRLASSARTQHLWLILRAAVQQIFALPDTAWCGSLRSGYGI